MSKKLLVTKGVATRSNKLLVAPGITTKNKKLLVRKASLLVASLLLAPSPRAFHCEVLTAMSTESCSILAYHMDERHSPAIAPQHRAFASCFRCFTEASYPSRKPRTRLHGVLVVLLMVFMCILQPNSHNLSRLIENLI